MKTKIACGLLVAVISLVAMAANAAFTDPNFSGVTDYDEWNNLTASNPQVAEADPAFPTFFTSSSPWPEPIESALVSFDAMDPNDPNDDVVIVDPTGDAVYDKVSGSGYPAGQSIYNSFGSGTFSVSDSNVVPGLETVVFQIEMAPGVSDFGGPNEAAGFFETGGLPVLRYNGGTLELAADFSDDFPTGETFPNPVPPPATVDVTIFRYQWNLSGLGAITEYEIEWSTIPFLTTYGARLDASDSFVQVVPEPATLCLAGLGGIALLTRRRLA